MAQIFFGVIEFDLYVVLSSLGHRNMDNVLILCDLSTVFYTGVTNIRISVTGVYSTKHFHFATTVEEEYAVKEERTHQPTSDTCSCPDWSIHGLQEITRTNRVCVSL